MIRLYTDEDVDVLIKPLLNAKGFTVFTTLGEEMLGKSDREQLERAINLRCAFLTHNRVHFEELSIRLSEEGKGHCGIIIATRRNIYELARRVARFLELQTAESIKNQVWYI
ncbi:MAG: DUF5615 family PIN-like protein [Nitrospirae bacterium]|nr:DUF5615 family PIN-like protein [Nitrospirota bacterium]